MERGGKKGKSGTAPVATVFLPEGHYSEREGQKVGENALGGRKRGQAPTLGAVYGVSNILSRLHSKVLGRKREKMQNEAQEESRNSRVASLGGECNARKIPVLVLR